MLNLDLLIPPPGSGGSAGNHVVAFVILFNFYMHHDHVLKKLSFDLLTPSQGSGGSEDIHVAKSEFGPFDPRPPPN